MLLATNSMIHELVSGFHSSKLNYNKRKELRGGSQSISELPYYIKGTKQTPVTFQEILN